MNAAESHQSRLKSRAEAPLERELKEDSGQLNDPLLHVDEYAYDGSVGATTNEELDRTAYGETPRAAG